MDFKDKLKSLSKKGGRVLTNELAVRIRKRKESQILPQSEKKVSELKRKLKAGRKDTTPEMSETKRICSLPIDLGMDERAMERFNYDTLLAAALDDGFRLFDCQADAMHDYIRFGGGFFAMGVGWGKTLTTLFIAAHAYKQGLFKSLLLVPPSVYPQLVNHDIPWARTKITLALPFIKLGKLTKAKRMALAKSGRPGCYIMPYSLLSTADSVELLHSVSPQLIICDEAHRLKNRTASRTKRFLNHVHETNPQIVCLSGTITSKRIADYQHLIRLALGDTCPIPRSPIMAGEWGAVIDSGVFSIESCLARPLVPLLHWARNSFPQEDFPEITSGFRRAYKNRLVTAPGVVATGDAEIGTSLVLSNTSVNPDESASKKVEGWKELKKYMQDVDELYLTPNGDEIEHAIHAFKWKYELSAGFYNELVWPAGDTPEIRAAKEHHAAGQVYAKALRKFLQKGARPGYDTPMLVGKNMSLYGAKFVGIDLFRLWKEMKAMEFPGMPQRIRNQIRVCPYKVNAVVKYAACLDRGEGALIWVWHKEMGKWIYENLQEAGVDARYAQAGPSYDEMILNPKNRDKVVVASMAAHGTGKNLQAFQNQMYAQWPRPATEAEQTLGRTHRNGQEADELVVKTLQSNQFDHEVFAACLNDALYIQQTTSQRQKLIVASYDPMPKIFSPEFLRERGLENEYLDGEMRKAINDRFGEFK